MGDQPITTVAIEHLTALGFASVTGSGDHYPLTEEQADLVRAELDLLVETLRDGGIALEGLDVELHDLDNFSFEPPRFGDGPTKLAFSVAPSAPRRPKYALNFTALFSRARATIHLARALAVGFAIPQVSSVSLALRLPSRASATAVHAEICALVDLLPYWFDKVAAEPAEAKVQLDFDTSWGVNLYRFASNEGVPESHRITGCLGEPGTPVGSRQRNIEHMDRLLGRLGASFDRYKRLEFTVKAWQGRLDVMGDDYLEALVPVADALGSDIHALGAESQQLVPLSVVVNFGHQLVVEDEVKGLTPKVSVYLPWFHGNRLPAVSSAAQLAEMAQCDLERARRIRGWMRETGRVTMFWIDDAHGDLMTDDGRLQLLLDALRPHIDAIDRDEFEPFGKTFLFIEDAGTRTWNADNYLKIPLAPGLAADDLKAAIDDWFAENPIPPLDED